MNISLVRFAVVAALTLSAASVACSAPTPEPLPTSGGASTESQDQRSAKADDSQLPPSSGGKADAPANTDGGAAPGEKGGGKGEGEELPPADPQCVATCNSGVKAKCEGDDTFCEDICSFYTPTEIACITQAPTCEKSVWVGCIQDEGGGEGGGKGGGGK